MKQTYSARDVAHIVGITESRVRYWAQTGVVGPSQRESGRTVYTFQDLVGVKTAKELLDHGVTLQRARKNLEALRAQLPGLDRPLTRLRVRSDGERLVVSDGGAAFEPLSGQLVMDFAIDDLEGQVAELAVSAPVPVEVAPSGSGPQSSAPAGEPRTDSASRADSAFAWFIEGGNREASGDDDGALIAYAKALEGDPALAAAHTNLGNLLYRRGERGVAREHYEQALALDPEQPEARYNLGNLLDELGEPALARMEWYRVVTGCPEFADAYYNLAIASAREGDADAARAHLGRYLLLKPDDARAQELLSSL